MVLLGGALVPKRRFGKVSRRTATGSEHVAEPRLRAGVALYGRLHVPLKSSFRVLG